MNVPFINLTNNYKGLFPASDHFQISLVFILYPTVSLSKYTSIIYTSLLQVTQILIFEIICQYIIQSNHYGKYAVGLKI